MTLHFFVPLIVSQGGAGKGLSTASVYPNAAAMGMSGGKLHVEVQQASRLPTAVNAPMVQLRILNEHQRKVKDSVSVATCIMFGGLRPYV